MKTRLSRTLCVLAILTLLGVITSPVLADIYPGPGGSVGGVSVGYGHYIGQTSGASSFVDQFTSTSATSITWLGGDTSASRVWCGDYIRDSQNHGGWMKTGSSSASLPGGIQWGATCATQRAGTAATHSYSANGTIGRYDWYAREARR